jgi:acyl-CoA synthetase (AMP-forming)/AMP-acid ligase II
VKIQIWQGYHNPQLREQLRLTWDQDDLLVLCPPFLKDFSFVSKLQTQVAIIEGQTGEKPVLGVFTSGTQSGEPRLVLYSKRNIFASLKEILSIFDESKITSVFCYPQPFHTFGLLLGYMLSIHKNIPMISPEGKYGRLSHQARLAWKDPGTLTLGTPTHFFDLIAFLEKSDKKLSPSYSCIMGGAPVSVNLWKNVQTKLSIEKPSIGYGCTEASPGITHHPAGFTPLEDGEIGFPLKSLESKVIPHEGVQISGESLCLAMFENGELVLPQTLCVRDAIEVRGDGMWIYKGRLDLMLNRGGTKFSLEAIERVILAETGLQIVSSTCKDERLGQELCILLQTHDLEGFSEDYSVITRVLEKHFGLKLLPQNFKKVKEVPLNDSQKVDRKYIQKLFERGSYEQANL